MIFHPPGEVGGLRADEIHGFLRSRFLEVGSAPIRSASAILRVYSSSSTCCYCLPFGYLQVEVGHRQDLTAGALPVLSSIIPDDQGKQFYVRSDTIAREIAISLQAAKLILFTISRGIYSNHNLLSDITIDEAQQVASDNTVTGVLRAKLLDCIRACRYGVDRCHIINWRDPGSILYEIFTGREVGTMIRTGRDSYHGVRAAVPDDIPSILNVLDQHSVLAGELRTWNHNHIRDQIETFLVLCCDGTVRACICVRKIGTFSAEIVVFAVHRDDVTSAIGIGLFDSAAQYVREAGGHQLFVLVVRAWDWFEAAGFVRSPLAAISEIESDTRDSAGSTSAFVRSL